MTTWTIELADGRRAQVVGDEVRVVDGSLVIGRATEPPPAPLHTVAVFALHHWRLAFPLESPIAARGEAPPERPVRILPETHPEVS